MKIFEKRRHLTRNLTTWSECKWIPPLTLAFQNYWTGSYWSTVEEMGRDGWAEETLKSTHSDKQDLWAELHTVLSWLICQIGHLPKQAWKPPHPMRRMSAENSETTVCVCQPHTGKHRLLTDNSRIGGYQTYHISAKKKNTHARETWQVCLSVKGISKEVSTQGGGLIVWCYWECHSNGQELAWESASMTIWHVLENT